MPGNPQRDADDAFASAAGCLTTFTILFAFACLAVGLGVAFVG